MAKYIRNFSEIGLGDVPSVGGKNASLGEMFNQLMPKGIRVPAGFATTSEAFWQFIDANNLRQPIKDQLARLDRIGYSNLKEIGKAIRELVLGGQLPTPLVEEISSSYWALSGVSPISVAVRSSATAEDLPDASFAGQHESYLNISGKEAVLEAVKRCYASMYTDRAIKYREDNGFDHNKVALSVGIQKMVRSDKGCSGVCFTLEPESGFCDIVHISGAWGLGENVVQGTVNPDEFFVFKPTLIKGKNGIIQKKMGDKAWTMVYNNTDSGAAIKNIKTSEEQQHQFVLEDRAITELALWALIIEAHYQKPMDIEWAKDGEDGLLYIVQARPETVHSRQNAMLLREYKLQSKGTVLVKGEAIGGKIVSGKVRLLSAPQDGYRVQPGDIVVTDLTSPDWDPILKNAAAIITNKGGRTSHASIVARELGVPAIVGTEFATTVLKEGQQITVCCAEGKTGFVYDGLLNWKEVELDFTHIHTPKRTKAMLILADPEKAFKQSFYPNDGVGLMRIEFIINDWVQIHPMALAKFDELKDTAVKKMIEAKTNHATDKKQYFIDKLAQGVATIAAAFYPKEVIVRMSDFKTNEYADLLGGKDFEPIEENPMLGFRGASRYYHPRYKPGFRLECEAMKQVRNDMGLTNVKLMIPFCRTVEEGQKVIATMSEFGLKRGENGLEVYVMAEIPSNVLQADEFAQIFDGFSIGSNDLTQLTLGIDRDSAIIANLFSEQNKSAKTMVALAIAKARKAKTPIGLCGQAPSDYPEFAQFLIGQGINSISFNPDAILKGIENMQNAERLNSVQ